MRTTCLSVASDSGQTVKIAAIRKRSFAGAGKVLAALALLLLLNCMGEALIAKISKYGLQPEVFTDGTGDNRCSARGTLSAGLLTGSQPPPAEPADLLQRVRQQSLRKRNTCYRCASCCR